MSIKLGDDFYSSQGDTQYYAQRNLLIAISDVTPEVLEALKSNNEIANLFQQVTAEPPTDATGTMNGIVIHWFQLETTENTLRGAKRRALGSVMRNWAISFNLDYPWVLDEALHTLWLWHTKAIKDDAPKTWNFHPRYGIVDVSEWKRTFTFTHVHDDTDFANLDRDALRRSALQAFDDAFDANFKYIVDERLGPGWHPTFEKESRMHFEWLALALVKGLRSEQIAEKYCSYDKDQKPRTPDRSTISKGIVNCANLVGIPTPVPQGRPKATGSG